MMRLISIKGLKPSNRSMKRRPKMDTSYWVGSLIGFAVILYGIYWVLKKVLKKLKEIWQEG
jgi:hypothetical protein